MLRRRRPGLPYLPLPEAVDVPNVMVDGAPLPGTVLTLSHWPRSPTPPEWRRDLSAESVLDFVAAGARTGRARVVTGDHFDQDGLVSLFAMVDPEQALARRALLTEVARVGDFAVVAAGDSDAHAAGPDAAIRVAFALTSLADPDRSPLGGEAGRPGAGSDGTLHRLGLELLPGLVDDPGAQRHLWEEEDSFLADSRRQLDGGKVRVHEVPAVDLAVVTAAEDVGWRPASEFTHRTLAVVHPVALHARTGQMRVLTSCAGRHELRFRYESWVRLASRRVAPRVDAAPLVERLQAKEPGRGRWTWNGASATIARLVGEGSDLAPGPVRTEVESFLAGAPPAWDPY